jgi:ADP-ribose pyrophosphatase
MNKNKKLYVIKKEVIYAGKWLNFETITYSDSHGNMRHWENVSRTTKRGAVIIIAKMSHSGKIVLVRQFRPPINNYVIEFPAGLVDENESFESAAVRELKEETGYVGKIKKIIPPALSSPGMTNESVAIALVELDEDLPENNTPSVAHDATEDIQVFLIEQDKIAPFLKERNNVGDSIDAKLMCFLIGQNFDSLLNARSS